MSDESCTSKPQFAEVRQPFDKAPPMIHCPVCGKQPLTDAEEGPRVDPCEHLVYVYFGFIDELVYQSEEFLRLRGDVVDDHEVLDDLDGFIEKIGYGDNLLALSVSYGGIGCYPPIWEVNKYGFDFDMPKDDPAD
jgi:hypothetical protein